MAKTKEGRPKKTDDLMHHCNKDISTLYRLAMNWMKWTHFVKYVWMPPSIQALKQQRPSSRPMKQPTYKKWSMTDNMKSKLKHKPDFFSKHKLVTIECLSKKW